MALFGIDISHWQGSFDVARAAREGIEFFILKATEGTGYTDPRFAENLRNVRATGKLVAAYHYQRADSSAAAQVAHISRVVPRDVPVIPDVEANSGNVALTRDIVNRLRAAGYRVPLTYLPRWYWQQIGSPSLTGLPPLWSSRYPDNQVGDIRAKYAQVPGHYWDGYGGLSVAVLQFTSSARVAGRSPIDGNAYRGSLAQLRTLFGTTGGGGAAPGGGDDVRPSEWTAQDRKVAYETMWWGAPGARLISTREPGVPDGWPEYVLGSLSDRIVRQTLAPMRDQLVKLVDLVAKQNGVTADELAEALTPRLTEALLPGLDQAVERVLGKDNHAQAEAIVAELARILAAGTAQDGARE